MGYAGSTVLPSPPPSLPGSLSAKAPHSCSSTHLVFRVVTRCCCISGLNIRQEHDSTFIPVSTAHLQTCRTYSWSVSKSGILPFTQDQTIKSYMKTQVAPAMSSDTGPSPWAPSHSEQTLLQGNGYVSWKVPWWPQPSSLGDACPYPRKGHSGGHQPTPSCPSWGPEEEP